MYYFHLQDVARELSTELKGEPDLIIGNYTDGNLVASLLSHRLGVTQVFFSYSYSSLVLCSQLLSLYLATSLAAAGAILPLKHPHMQIQELMIMPQF